MPIKAGPWLDQARQKGLIAEEREACAKLAEKIYHEDCGVQRGLEPIFEHIRNRGHQ